MDEQEKEIEEILRTFDKAPSPSSDSKVYEFEKTKEERSGLLKTALDNSLFTSGTTVSDHGLI